MHLQEYIYHLTLTVGSRSHKMLPSTFYVPATFEVATSNSIWGDAFTRKYINWHWPQGKCHAKQCPVPSTSWDLCTCQGWSYHPNSLGGYALIIKYTIWPWNWGRCHTKWFPVPSASYDPCTCKVWSCYVKQFRRGIYKKIHYLTFGLDIGSRSQANVTRTSTSTLCIMLNIHPQCLKLIRPTVWEQIQLQETWQSGGQTYRRTDDGPILVRN